MKKLMIIAAVATCTFAAFAADNNAKKAPKTPEEIAANRQRMLERTGGIIERPASGKIAIYNFQQAIGNEAITASVARVDAATRHVKIDQIKEGAFEVKTASELMRKGGYDFAIFIVDDETLPMSLVAMESHWGMINAAKLKVGAEGEKLNTRFSKEFIRVSTLTFGGVSSAKGNSPLQAAKTGADLDGIVSNKYTFDAIVGMLRYLDASGVKGSAKAPYILACKQGWAPAPTNDYQKAIWEKVHAIPTEPIKIKYQKPNK